MSFSDTLRRTITKINDVDPNWRHFLKDYHSKILSTCTTIELSDYHSRVYEFRLRDMLRENQIPVDLTWVIIWINNLESEYNFSNITKILLPNYQELLRIRNLYDGSRRAS